MKILKTDGSCINLTDDITEIKVTEMSLMAGLLNLIAGEEVCMQEYGISAFKKKGSILGTYSSEICLGIYDSEDRAQKICEEVIRAWVNGEKFYQMPTE